MLRIETGDHPQSTIVATEAVTPPVDPNTIPFISNRDLMRLVLKRGGLEELHNLKRVCKIARTQYVKSLFDYDGGFLDCLAKLPFGGRVTLLRQHQAHLDSVLPFADQYEAAYTTSALLGGINKLDPKGIQSNLAYLYERQLPQWLIDCVELIYAIYYPASTPLVPLMDRMAKCYVDGPEVENLGVYRPLFLFILLRTTRLLEKDETVDNRYDLVPMYLKTAMGHPLFARKREERFGLVFFSRMVGSTKETYSVTCIKEELAKVEKRMNQYVDAKFSRLHIHHHGNLMLRN